MSTNHKGFLVPGFASILAILLTLFSVSPLHAESEKERDKDKTNETATATADTHRSGAATDASTSSGETYSHHNPFFTKGALQGSSTTGGVDPHGDSWQSIQNSLQQFAHPAFVLRLFLSLTMAVGCAWLIAWHPRTAKRRQSFSDMEERKALILLGLAGAIVAELGSLAPTLAFVIFGIGSLLRFRTVLDNPKATGKAILVVVIGLASGMGSWMMAVFVTAFSWGLIFWLDSHHVCQMTIRLEGDGDSKPIQSTVQSLLLENRCRLQTCKLSKSRKRIQFLFQMPVGLDHQKLELDVKAKLPKNGESRVSIEPV